MSNIYTSYIRIKRKDNERLSEKEIDYLFKTTVKAYSKFGSYWVRIVKKYREVENCLDIQFGSGKRGFDGIEDIEDIESYSIWERFNDEGGLDTIFTYFKDSTSDCVDTTISNLCKYGFDRIRITSGTNWLDKYGIKGIGGRTEELEIKGVYNASNSKSFVDLIGEFDGPCLLYTENYHYDFFVLTESEWIRFLEPIWLKELCLNKFDEMPNDSKLEFYWNYRKVAVISKYHNEVSIQSADYWDNCINEEFINCAND